VTPIPAAAAAKARLAAKLGVARIRSRSCPLSASSAGLLPRAATEGEFCAQVITPGYRIVLEVNGKEYEAHADERGQAVRIVTP